MVTLGEFLFPSCDLYWIGDTVHGFSLGESVTWTSEDSGIPRGSVGIVVGAHSGNVTVMFSAGKYNFDLASLRSVELQRQNGEGAKICVELQP